MSRESGLSSRTGTIPNDANPLPRCLDKPLWQGCLLALSRQSRYMHLTNPDDPTMLLKPEQLTRPAQRLLVGLQASLHQWGAEIVVRGKKAGRPAQRESIIGCMVMFFDGAIEVPGGASDASASCLGTTAMGWNSAPRANARGARLSRKQQVNRDGESAVGKGKGSFGGQRWDLLRAGRRAGLHFGFNMHSWGALVRCGRVQVRDCSNLSNAAWFHESPGCRSAFGLPLRVWGWECIGDAQIGKRGLKSAAIGSEQHPAHLRHRHHQNLCQVMFGILAFTNCSAWVQPEGRARSEPNTSAGGGGGGVEENWPLLIVISNTINLADFNISYTNGNGKFTESLLIAPPTSYLQEARRLCLTPPPSFDHHRRFAPTSNRG
ncbi:hypothetical protein FB45DRAFT_882849 [Roridomyces roridus]|uniref:Uncharacterized protein n=1 Tax=Roridomyces roridus TaxID=1738132 RepID=A0AAD7AXI7_9AGAR|nr:hypothetical protein FB45DRAFT_882849 [Roridomyces roridus]